MNINISSCLPRVKDISEATDFFNGIKRFEGAARVWGVYAFHLGDEDSNRNDVDRKIVELRKPIASDRFTPDRNDRKIDEFKQSIASDQIGSEGQRSSAVGLHFEYMTTFREWKWENLGLICEILDSVEGTWEVTSKVISLKTESSPLNLIDLIRAVEPHVDFSFQKIKLEKSEEKCDAKKRRLGSSTDFELIEEKCDAKKRRLGSSTDFELIEEKCDAKKPRMPEFIEGGFDFDEDDIEVFEDLQSPELPTVASSSVSASLDEYKSWNGPYGYDESFKRSNKYKQYPHEHVLCKYSDDCEFNSRPVEERSIYSLNRHFVQDHRVDMELQTDPLGDIFFGSSASNKQRFLQCGYCLAYMIYGFKEHVRGEWERNLFAERWWNDNSEIAKFVKRSARLSFSSASDFFSDSFHVNALLILKEGFLKSNCDVRLKENILWFDSEERPGGNTEFYVFSSVILCEAYSGSCNDLDQRIYGHMYGNPKLERLLKAPDVRVTVFAIVKSSAIEFKKRSVVEELESLVVLLLRGVNQMTFLNSRVNTRVIKSEDLTRLREPFFV